MKNLFILFALTLSFCNSSFAQNEKINGNLILDGSRGRFIFTQAWQAGQDFLVIAPDGVGTNNPAWNWGRELRFDASGELIKNVTNANDRALTVRLNGTRNFQVMGDGTVYAREMEVNLLNFPDYVFEKDYNLLTLGQLESFISKNKHLPNIPSALEVENEGIGLGKLVKLELEKIEELTLYIIDLNNEIKALKSEIAEIKKNK